MGRPRGPPALECEKRGVGRRTRTRRTRRRRDKTGVCDRIWIADQELELDLSGKGVVAGF